MSLFFIENGIVYGLTFKDEKYVVDETLEELDKKLCHTNFFKANRQLIASRKTIVEVSNYFNGRLMLKTTPKTKEKILQCIYFLFVFIY